MVAPSIIVNGKIVKMSVESGLVAGLRKQSITHVRGNGVSTTSTVERRTEFSLIGVDGVERPHWFTDDSIFLRDSHRVSLIYAEYKQKEWMYIVNHDTKQCFYLWGPSDYVVQIGLIRRLGCLWCIAVIAALGILSSGVLLIPAIVGVILFNVIQSWRAGRIWQKYLHPEFERLERELFAATEQIPWPQIA